MKKKLLEPNSHDTSVCKSNSVSLKDNFNNAGPPTLQKISDSISMKKKLKNVGPPTLHKPSNSKNLKKRLSNGELIGLKTSALSDRFNATKVGKQASQSTSARHNNRSILLSMLQSAKKLPVASEIVDYPINLTGKGKI